MNSTFIPDCGFNPQTDFGNGPLNLSPQTSSQEKGKVPVSNSQNYFVPKTKALRDVLKIEDKGKANPVPPQEEWIRS